MATTPQKVSVGDFCTLYSLGVDRSRDERSHLTEGKPRPIEAQRFVQAERGNEQRPPHSGCDWPVGFAGPLGHPGAHRDVLGLQALGESRSGDLVGPRTVGVRRSGTGAGGTEWGWGRGADPRNMEPLQVQFLGPLP